MRAARAGLLMIALFAFGIPVPAGQGALPDVRTIGPQIGEVVPDFSLTDQNGQTQSLKSVLGPNGAMLVFFRSADW